MTKRKTSKSKLRKKKALVEEEVEEEVAISQEVAIGNKETEKKVVTETEGSKRWSSKLKMMKKPLNNLKAKRLLEQE